MARRNKTVVLSKEERKILDKLSELLSENVPKKEKIRREKVLECIEIILNASRDKRSKAKRREEERIQKAVDSMPRGACDDYK